MLHFDPHLLPCLEASQSDSGSSDATTRSAVSAGTINIMDGANQKQDVASLSRDTVDTNGKVANTPDLNALLNQQADRMQAAQAAGQAVAQRIGDYADAQAKATHDPAWAEGGDKRAAMQAAGAAVVAGLGGGVGSAVAGAAGAAIGSKMAPTLNELSGSIAASNPTGDADVNKALGNIVANVVATDAGAAAGGAGAFSGSNVDLYNRQLHPDERKLAKDIADKSNGQYTQAQVEDQMRLMGMCTSGGCVPSGVAEELNGRTPTDPGAVWINTGLTNANGNPLVIQSLPQANQALQSFIMENYNSAAPGQVPSAYTYTPSPVGMDVRGTVANVAGGVSTAAGRFSAATAAAAQIPSPYSPGFTTASFAGTAVGMAADGIVQIAKPDVGQYYENSVVGIAASTISGRVPALSPAVNEAANQFNSSSWGNSIQEFINSSWSRFIGSGAGK
ncbi:hypothetical protein LMG28688_05523 [Paraburkholderia caffeinitolerans]|uniref:Hemolysin n=1 Tax=Paraburkholderia caffeinitolerans TaxID=1723730 RepID=A0A6J5GKZ9_9BURK|nr:MULTISPECIES: hemolysin [Paraburkholderia]CAB3802179.1 hypothetical protein LMG28688_05523 [Paraburkholderia caffeinitolerans]